MGDVKTVFEWSAPEYNGPDSVRLKMKGSLKELNPPCSETGMLSIGISFKRSSMKFEPWKEIFANVSGSNTCLIKNQKAEKIQGVFTKWPFPRNSEVNKRVNE